MRNLVCPTPFYRLRWVHVRGACGLVVCLGLLLGGIAFADESKRTLVEGVITEVLLSGPEAQPNIVGVISVQLPTGEVLSFKVHKYTLILVRTPEHNIYAARLDQLKPGWTCQVAWDLPADTDPPPDFARALPTADNILADIPRPSANRPRHPGR